MCVFATIAGKRNPSLLTLHITPSSSPLTLIQVYALGGYNISDNYNSVATGEVLDPATGKWSFIANMTIPRGDLQVRG